MSPKTAVSFSYAVFSLQVDEAGAVSVPIGVALWSPEKDWVDFRLVGEKERLKQFKSQQDFPFIRLANEKIRHWLTCEKLPYAEQPLQPSSDSWWRHARQLLIHRVRLSEPRPIDCRDPADELEPLYEAVVGAHRSEKEARTRVDGLITKCLDNLSGKFQARRELAGYRGRHIRVLRSYEGKKGWVIIEGVNLTSPKADYETDAAVSRLLRLREGLKKKPQVLVGYLASPEGINGEEVLVDWIRTKTQAGVFDLITQRKDFHDAADAMFAKAEGKLF